MIGKWPKIAKLRRKTNFVWVRDESTPKFAKLSIVTHCKLFTVISSRWVSPFRQRICRHKSYVYFLHSPVSIVTRYHIFTEFHNICSSICLCTIQYTQRWTKILINFNYIDYHNSQECGQGREGMVYIYLKRRCYFLIPSIPILNKWILSDMCRMRFFFENRYSLH